MIKTGPGWLTLPNANRDFLGDITITQGTLLPAVASALGYDDMARVVTVADGGALDMGLLPSVNNCIYVYQLRLAGDGPDGNGALVNNGAFIQYYTQPLIALDADASIGGVSRLDVRRNSDVAGTIQPRFELNGYTLTVKGDAKLTPDLRSSTSPINSIFAITSADILVADPAAPDRHGTFAIAPGAVFTIESDSTLAGDTNTLVSVSAGSVFDVHNLAAPVPWRIQAEAGSALRTRSGFDRDTRNVITGPVETSGNGDLILTDTANTCSLTLTSPFRAPPVSKVTAAPTRSPIARLQQYLSRRNHDPEVGTCSSPTTLSLRVGRRKIHVSGGGLLGIGMGDTPAEGFTRDHFDTLVYGDLIPSDGGVVVDTTRLADPDIVLSDAVNKGFGKTGPGDLTILAPISAWVFTPEDGITDFRDSGPHTLGYISTTSGSLLITNDADVTVGVVDDAALNIRQASRQSISAVLRVNSTSNRIGTATVIAPDIGYGLRQTYFIVGQNGRATLDITDDALLSATLYAGRGGSSAGAIYQSGNSIVTNTTGAANDGGLGTASGAYGYYGLESGFNHTKGYWQVA